MTGLNWTGRVVVGLLLFLCLNPVSGASNQGADIKSLPLSMEWYEDESNLIALDTILSLTNDFQPLNGRANFGTRRSTLWFKVEIPAQQCCDITLLEISYPLLDQLDAFKQVDGLWQKSEMGDTRPFSAREFPHPLFIVPIDNATGETQTVYLRVRSKGPISVPISAWNVDYFYQHDRNRALFDGLYFGALLALILFNLFIYLSTRDNSYLYYVAYLGLIGLFMAATSGLLTQHILPDNPLLVNRLPYIFLYSAMIVGLRFTARINNTDTYAPAMLVLLGGLAMVLFAVLLYGNVADMYALSILTPYLAIIMIGLALYVTLLSVSAGYKPSNYVALAFLAIVAGGLASALGAAGVLNENFWVEHSLRLGVVFEALLFSFALAYRIRYMQQILTETREKASLERTDFSRKLIEARDSERQEIATELHDGLGQSLLVIKNKLGRFITPYNRNTGNGRPPLELPVTELRKIIQSTIDDTRNLSHRLHPHVLDRLGLTEATKAVFKETLDGHTTRIESRIEDVNLPQNSPLELHLYRIVQESVKNIAQHANPARVEVSLRQSTDSIELYIEDFPNNLATPWIDSININQSFGLSSILERVELLSGNTVFSHNNLGGFRIQISIPFSL